MKVDVANRVDRANRVWVKKGVILSGLEKGWVNWVTGRIGLGRVDPYFFHMFFYPVVLPSLEFGIGHDLGFLCYSYTHIFFKFINKSRN